MLDPAGDALQLDEVGKQLAPRGDRAVVLGFEDEQRPVVDLVADDLERVGGAVEGEVDAAARADAAEIVDARRGGEPRLCLAGADAALGEDRLERVAAPHVQVLGGRPAAAVHAAVMAARGVARPPMAMGDPRRALATRSSGVPHVEQGRDAGQRDQLPRETRLSDDAPCQISSTRVNQISPGRGPAGRSAYRPIAPDT